MPKAEFLMLAQDYNPSKHWISNFYLSEKLDGTRAFWDGGISRGLLAKDVPYANVAKDKRYVNAPIATGLWSRYGNVIHAPDYFLDDLPPVPFDGELWMGRGSFQRCRSVVSTLYPEQSAWMDVRYMVFDSPGLMSVFGTREINVTNFKKKIDSVVQDWVNQRCSDNPPRQFETSYVFLNRVLTNCKRAQAHPQIRLPLKEDDAKAIVEETLIKISEASGEGVMLRAPYHIWEPHRTYSLLKVKKLKDAEAIVIGYTSGRETNKGSKLLGKIGALITTFNGKRLELSGFTDEEREFETQAAIDWATNNPGIDCPNWINSLLFPRGSIITFKYRELSDDNVPKEARYFRKAT